VESAHCPKCGYTPSGKRRAPAAGPKGAASRRRARRATSRAGHQRFLDELLSHWNGTHEPDHSLQLSTPEQAQLFFQEYQRALGEDPSLTPGAHMAFVRSHQPERREVLWFVGAYLLLRQGKRDQAAAHLRDLTKLYPKFVDAWVWLTATTDDPEQRIDYLEDAVLIEPAHALARDALAIALGRVPAAGPGAARDGSTEARLVHCPKCSGALHYEAGAREVVCQYCGQGIELEEVDLLEGEATLVGDLRLRRRSRGQAWTEAQRVLQCRACGAELTMARLMTNQCLFCGSVNVLAADSDDVLVRPDGFLPFRVSEEGAGAAIRKAQQSTGQRLKTWWTGAAREVRDLRPVYLPFWVFDGFVEVRSPGGSRFDRPDPSVAGLVMSGLRPGTVTPSAPAQGAPEPRRDLFMFDNLLYSGMEFPPPELLGRILPYELGALVPYEDRLLADWPAALYQKDVEEVVEVAYDAMLGLAVRRSGPALVASSPAEAVQLRRSFQVTSATYQLILLPVWVALAQREERHRLVLVNGQTGKVVVSSPLRRRNEDA
jgi:hypothetical protein